MINSKQDLTNHQIAHSIIDVVHTLFRGYLNATECNLNKSDTPFSFSEYADQDEIEVELTRDEYQYLLNYVNAEFILKYRDLYQDLLDEIANSIHAKYIEDKEIARPKYSSDLDR